MEAGVIPLAEIDRIQFRAELNEAGDAAHVSLVDRREHDTDGRDCWCRPQFYRICDECETSCWKCDAGKIELSRDEALATDDVLLIVHRP